MRENPKVTLGKTEDGKTYIITHFSLDDPPFFRLDFEGKQHKFETKQECSEVIHLYHEENVWQP